MREASGGDGPCIRVGLAALTSGDSSRLPDIEWLADRVCTHGKQSSRACLTSGAFVSLEALIGPRGAVAPSLTQLDIPAWILVRPLRIATRSESAVASGPGGQAVSTLVLTGAHPKYRVRSWVQEQWDTPNPAFAAPPWAVRRAHLLAP